MGYYFLELNEKKKGILGIAKQNYTKHVHFSFFNPLTTELTVWANRLTVQPKWRRNDCNYRHVPERCLPKCLSIFTFSFKLILLMGQYYSKFNWLCLISLCL